MRVTIATALLASSALAWGALAAVRAEEPNVNQPQELNVGDTPAALALNDQDGKAVRLGAGKDHGWFVLAFYPKASTGG